MVVVTLVHENDQSERDPQGQDLSGWPSPSAGALNALHTLNGHQQLTFSLGR